VRLALSNIVVPMDPDLDQFGDQIITLQAFGVPDRATFSIFDTGASAVTFAYTDQEDFDATVGAIPIKVPGGAIAEGIGGAIIGDVSDRGRIYAVGLNAADLTFDEFGFPIFNFDFNSPGGASTPGIQTFVGTEDGSPILPAITGTPLLVPNIENPNGLAAYVDMLGAQLDFSDLIPDLILAMPNVNFVQPDSPIAPAAATSAPTRILLTTYGADNYANPGNLITESYNYVQTDTSAALGSIKVDHQTFLFDTGAQLSVVSTDLAIQLGLDLANPETSITVQGVAGEEDVPGYTIDSLVVPTADGTITFTNVPVYVLDVAPDIQGILGMNLFNTADKLMFDPYSAGGPSVSVNFFTDPNRGLGDGGDLGDLGALLGGLFGGQQFPTFQFAGSDVSGHAFQDNNRNGARNQGEPALAGVTMYLDANNNGQLDSGEPTDITDGAGAFAFHNPPNGSYTLREVVPAGMMLDPTAPQSFPVVISGNTIAANLNFRNLSALTSHYAVVGPSGATAGAAVSFTVSALNQANGAVGSYTGTVHFTSSDPSAVLPPDYTFVANDAGVHTFSIMLKTPGNQTITVVDTASGNAVTGSSGPAAVVAPIGVGGLQIADGSGQRSAISSITVNFSRAVGSVDAGAFQVTRQGGGDPILAVSWNAARTAATLTFTGGQIIGGSLQDGNYSLIIDSTKIHDATGGLLDGNADGLSGGVRAADAFFRLFGDSDGDRDVDNLDLFRFRQAFGMPSNSSAFKSYFDFDGDGDIDNLDLFRFRQRFGVPFPPGNWGPRFAPNLASGPGPDNSGRGASGFTAFF
jgi:hypothetical protein